MPPRKRQAARDVFSGPTDASGLPHGRGTMQFASGHVFEGRFEHGVRQGRGVLSSPDGSSMTGVFVDDEMCGEGTSYDPEVRPSACSNAD